MKTCKSMLLFLLCGCTLQSFSQVLPLDSVLNRIEKNNPMLNMYDEQINAINSYSLMARQALLRAVGQAYAAPYDKGSALSSCFQR